VVARGVHLYIAIDHDVVVDDDGSDGTSSLRVLRLDARTQ